jgi:hypothetical protein
MKRWPNRSLDRLGGILALPLSRWQPISFAHGHHLAKDPGCLVRNFAEYQEKR